MDVEKIEEPLNSFVFNVLLGTFREIENRVAC